MTRTLSRATNVLIFIRIRTGQQVTKKGRQEINFYGTYYNQVIVVWGMWADL